SPIVVGALAAAFGWRAAVTTVGVVGLIVALVLSRQRLLGDSAARPPAARAPRRSAGLLAHIRPLFTAPILMAWSYFALIAASMSAVQAFGVAMMVAVYSAPLTLAAGALTGYMLGSATGVVCGGFLADRMRRHDVFASGGMAVAAALTLLFA